METVTTETIVGHLKKMVEQKIPVPPTLWAEAAEKLNILLGDENDKLFELQQAVAKMKVAYMAEGDSAIKARVKVEAEDIYRDMQKQKAFIEQIQEQIRISKLHSRLRMDEMKGY